MLLQRLADCLLQLAGTVTVHDPDLRQAGEQGAVEIGVEYLQSGLDSLSPKLQLFGGRLTWLRGRHRADR